MDPAKRKKFRTGSFFIVPAGLLLFATDAFQLINTSFWPTSLPPIRGFGLLLFGLGLLYAIRSVTSPIFVIISSLLFSLLPLAIALLLYSFGIADVDEYTTVAGVLTGFALGVALQELWQLRKAATPQSTA